jgi:Uri superfamily endonuclease
LARHARRRKPLRWHIDSLARCADPAGAIAWPWREGRECLLAQALGATATGRCAVPRFGASDCRCGGHLFELADDDLDRLAKALSSRLGEEPLLNLSCR